MGDERAKDAPEVLRFEGFTLDLARGALLDAAGAELPLRAKAFDLLRLLAERAGRAVPKAELMDALWPDVHVTEDSLFQCAREARRALGAVAGARLLRHVARRGYMLDAPVLREARAPCVEPGAARMAAADRTSLAVLPFANLGGDPGDEYLADGFAEELITALSRVRALLVIARGSSFAYRGPDVDARRVGRELGVRYVVEGGVRRGGGRLRVTYRLVEAATGAQLWADRLDGSDADVFALQEAAARAVAAAAEPRVMAAEIERAIRKGTADLTVYDLYLRALPSYWGPTERGKAKAVAALRRAVSLDPGFARALATLAHCLQLQATLGWRADVLDPAAEALRLARVALAADRSDALVLAIAGNLTAMLARREADHAEAEALAAEALAASEDGALVWTLAGWVSVLGGNPEEAIRRFGAAMRLDPRAPFAGRMHNGTAAAHFFARRFDDAVRWSRGAVVASPEYASSWRYLVASLAMAERLDEAREAAADAAAELQRRGTAGSLWQRNWRALRREWMAVLLKEGLAGAGVSEESEADRVP